MPQNICKQNRQPRASILIALALLALPLFSGCDIASAGCMTGDPDCSTSSLIAMIASLPAGRALYWGDANDNGIYKSELGTQNTTLLRFSPEYPKVLELSAD